MTHPTSMSHGDQERLQNAATQARTTRDYYRLEVRRAEETLREKRAALMQAEATYLELDAKCNSVSAPRLPGDVA